MPVSKNLELAQLANGLDINQSTGEVVTINLDTDAVSEGTTNLYLTNARVDARIALATGSNLNLSLVSVGALSDVDITTVAPTNGQALIWNSTNGEFEPGDSFSQTDFDTAFAAKIATDVTFGGNVIFEGATDDTNETTLTVVDPTADRTITLPDATGEVLVKDSSDIVTITSTDDGADEKPTLKLLRNSSSPADNDEIGEIEFVGKNDADEDTTYFRVFTSLIDVSDGTEDSRLEFKGLSSGSELTYFQMKGGKNFSYRDLELTSAKKLIFEGSTSDNFETSLTVTDPTADRTITLPDATGTVITTGNLTEITNLGVLTGDIVFEGATDDAFETTLTVVDPTADRTITLPDKDGTVLLQDSTTGLFTINATQQGSNYISNTGNFNYLYFQNATSGFGASDGIAIGVDTGGNAIFAQRASNGGTFNFVSFDGSGNYESRAQLGATNLLLNQNMSLAFEGATDDTNQTTLTVTDPTADRTITLPDVTGTVMVQDSNGVMHGSQANGSLYLTGNNPKLVMTDTDSDASILQFYNDASGDDQFFIDVDNPNTTANSKLTIKIDNSDIATFDTTGLLLTTGNILKFNGTLGFKTTLTLVNPSADRTITLPNETGTVALTSDITSSITANNLVPNFIRVSSDHSSTAAIRYLKVATIDTSNPTTSNTTFVFRLLFEGRSDVEGASQFRVHIRTGDATSSTSVIVEQEHSNRHTYFGIDSFIFFWNSQSNSEFWVKIPNNSDVAYQEVFAKLEVAAPINTEFVTGQDEVTIHTNQSWTTSAPSGTNQITAEWIKKRFDSIIFEGSTTNTSETFLNAVDPTADRTINLPNASGTLPVSVSSNSTTTQSELDTTGSINSSTGALTITGSAEGLATTDTPTFQGIDFATLSSNPSYSEGLLWYSNVNHTLNYYADDSNVIHELGLEEHQRVFNNTGSTILKGQPLYFSGNYVTGTIDVPTVGLADATDVNAYNAQGIAASDIATNSYGYCLIAGQLHDVDTSGLNAGTNFFVGLTPGAVQNASPVYPNYPMCLGWVVKSDATTGILLVNQQNHSVNSFRVRTSAHIGSDLQVDGDLTVLGSTTSVSTSDVTAGAPFYRANEGDAIGEAGTTFTGTGLDDAFFSGHFTGTQSTTYYVKIDSVGTPDTFAVSIDNFVSTISTNVAITGNKQLIHSADNIYVEFGATTGHTLNDQWTGVAGPVNVDTGFFSNRNTGTTGVGYTHVGLFFDVSDQKWKLVDEYDPTPAGTINTGHASYSEGTLVAGALEGNLDFSYIQNKPDPQITANLTGTVTGTGNVTLLDLQNGTLNIPTTIPGTTNLTLADLTVTNLTVTGTQTINNQSNLTSDDPLFVLNANQVGEPDIGMIGAYNDGTAQHTGFFRDASDDKWKLFDGYTPSVTSTGSINVSDPSFALTTLAAGTFEGNLDWSYIQNKPDPVVTVTLTGEVTGTGNATLTDLTSGTISLATTIDPNADVEVNDLEVTGNLNVQGTTTTVNQTTLTVTDSKIFLADGNNSDVIDIGTIFEYNDGANDQSAGLFRDANDSGKFKFFSTYTPAVGTTIDTAHASFALGTVVADTFEGNFVGNITGTISGSATSAATLTTPRNLWGQSFNGSADVTGDLTSVGNITGSTAIEVNAGGTNQNITLNPSGTGYTLLNGNVGIGVSVPSEKLEVAGNILVGGNIQFEGSTQDAFETTLAFTDPTSDRTITFPNSSGNVVVENSGSFTLEDTNLSSITLTETGGRTLEILVGAGAVPSVDNHGFIISDNDLQLRPRLTVGNVGVVRVKSAAHVEGALTISSNLGDLLFNNSGTITTVTDSATQARTITLPDATGTVALTSDLSNYLANIVEDTTPQLGGNLDAQTFNITNVGNLELTTGSTLSFEGATADPYETTLTVTDPTADRTITLPDATGTVMLNVVEDTSPQLGGDLNAQNNNLTNVGKVEIDSVFDIDSLLSTGLSAGSSLTINIGSLATYRGAKLLIQSRDLTSSQTMITEILVVHNGSTVFQTEYGVVNTGTAPVCEYDCGVNSGNLAITLTNPGSNAVETKISMTLMKN